MANWFKIYETDLDESRMKYAMSKLPEVWPVWTAVLMECCKHRSDQFSWGSEEQELFGFSDRLKISIPKVNEAISVLCEIKYCEKLNGSLKVLKWNEKQDDYLARKSQGYWKNRRENKKVTVIHSDSHIEERRGEEKRVEGPPLVPHFPEVIVEPSALPKPKSVGQDDVLFFRKMTCVIFARKESEVWSYVEEQAMCLVLKRSNWKGELQEVCAHYKTVPDDRKRFDFPATLRKMLEDWNGTLDKARAAAKARQKASTNNDNRGVRV